ncbi:ABC transporter substrate-binding protein [Rhodobaculum claviforme]|uniref:Spermidine/putrescine transport system substrate-binding protein n=1 Tax=Rhodobaculum claviforme TaxID=1549854 RepID=A0A934WIZ5_9RHOB|nr:ABC transporter substrate-binding protein [Rhodobaculum claviforme]MBK5928635.1 hypothetical protein [Rhodobaculum claviforme]
MTSREEKYLELKRAHAAGRMDRRSFLRRAGALGIVPLVIPAHMRPAFANAEELVVVNWGGPAEAAYMNAFGEPFTEETGIPVFIDGTGPSVGRIRAMVEANAVVWDVCDSGVAGAINLGPGGYLEPIDYSIVSAERCRPEFVWEHGIGNYLFCNVLTYNTEAFEEAPTTWADMWDVEKFPGGRTMRRNVLGGVMESALQAAGVAKEDVYDTLGTADGRALAFEKLEELKPHTLYWSSASESQQLYRTGEVTIGNIWHTRSRGLRNDSNGQFTWTWNQGQLTAGAWLVPRGNPAGAEAAMRFIAVAQEPENQVLLLEVMGNGPINPEAAALVPEELRADDPGQPENYDLMLADSEAFYSEYYDEVQERYLELIS